LFLKQALKGEAAASITYVPVIGDNYCITDNILKKQYDRSASIYGKPDIFLTFTCNPYWKEIQSNLYAGQTAADRPDLVARVFNLKVRALCRELFKRNVLGEVAAYIYVIEFQKRGLPHMHMLLTFKSEWKLNTAEQIDHLISAELPDPEEDPVLFELVSKNMIHRPCGSLNPVAACMKDGVCTK
uniref:Helitron_like_N domain-containing protein n=1 Tax=Heligmosomoides polygyrus TaxID=6339 RepID=A0A8L8KNB1_HELPZ